jgi:hypothetical protein
MQIDISKAVQKLFSLTKQLSTDKVGLGIARAINHTIAKGKTAASREIRSVYNIKAGEVGKSISIVKSTRESLEGRILIIGKPIPIIAFSPRQTATGVTVTIKKGSRKRIARAFIQTMKSGHTGVYARGRYNSGEFKFRTHRINRKGSDLPIGELTTTSVPTAFRTEKVLKAVAQNLEANLETRLAHELNNLIK